MLLLDDILAALDVHTAKWVAEKALGGDLLDGRTVILVTHNIALTGPIAQRVVALGRNGQVISTGTPEEVLQSNSRLRAEAEREKEKVAAETKAAELERKAEETEETENTDKPAKAGKLIVAEEVAIGRVAWKAISLYIVSFGGPLIWTIFFLFECCVMLINIYQKWIMAYWSSQYETHAPSEVPVIKCVSSCSSKLHVLTFTQVSPPLRTWECP